MKKMRKSLAWMLAVCMVIVILPATALAASYTDVSGHWAQAAIEKWSDLGIIQGSDGSFRPNDFITRGEMAVVIDRVMQYQTKATNGFSDLDSNFYTDSMLKANAAGVILGDGMTIRPSDNITREEAVVMLGRALGLTEKNESDASFTDSGDISSWALGYVNAMASKGYIHGSDGRVNAGAFITRAEIITILDNAIPEIMNKPKEYTGDVTGTVIVNTPGATLSNMKISGDLIISQGVGAGDVTLYNVKVTGNTIVRGGGANSIHITGGSQLANIVIKKTDSGDIRVVTSDGSVVNAVYVDDGSDNVILTGSFQNVTVEADVGVKAIDANIVNITVQNSNTRLDVDKDSAVESVHIADTAAGSALTVSGSVKTLTADAKVSVKNLGTITSAVVNADYVVLDGNKPVKVEIGPAVKNKPTDSSGNPVGGTTANSSGGSGGGETSVQLATPASLAWAPPTPGKATWGAVPNASSYTVQIYKDGTASGAPVTGITNAYYDFTSVITETGAYTFDVKAIGNGSYTGSAVSAKSAGYNYTASTITGITAKARHDAGVLAAGQLAQVNDNKFTMGQVQKNGNTYIFTLTGTGELTALDNPSGVSGKWIGVRIQLAGITDISTVFYSTDNVNYDALSADDAIAADARANSFMYYMDGSNNQATRYIKGADGIVVTLNFTFAPYVAPHACPALTNGVTFADDVTNDTNTVITLSTTSAPGNTFVYKISDGDNAVATPNVGDDMSAWTPVTNGASIEAINGKHIGVAEVDSQKKAVQFSDAQAVTEQSSDTDLTTVLGQAITATGAGTSDSPKTASVSVAGDVSSVGRPDIEATANATFNLYQESSFSIEVTDYAIYLTPGEGMDIYIKVIAEDNSTTVYYKVTVTRAAFQIATPTNLTWDTATPGKAKWDADPAASSYKVLLFKDQNTVPVDTQQLTDNYYDFTNTIKSKGTGSYAFTVAAVGDGTHYTDSETSGSSPAYPYTAPAITGVTMSPKTAAVKQGDTQQLTANVTAVGGAAAAVNWSSSDTNGKVTVDSSGRVEVAADAAAGAYTITATSAFDGTKSDTCAITVTQTPADVNSSITNWEFGALGSKQIILTVTVKDAAGTPITGLEASAFTIQVKQYDTQQSEYISNTFDFDAPSFSGFADIGDGTYIVVFTGIANYSSCLFNNLKVNGVIVEAEDINTITPRGVPPTLQSAEVGAGGTVLTMTFDKALFAPSDNSISCFSAKVNGQLRTFSAIALNSDESKTKIDLTLSGLAVAAGDTVMVSYSGGQIMSDDSGFLQETTDYTVTNNSTLAKSLTVSSATAGTATGTTVITVAETAGGDNMFVYKVSFDAVIGVKVSDTVTDGTPFTSASTEIPVTADQYVTIYEINSTSKMVVKYVSRKIVSSEFKAPSSDAGLNTVLSQTITATGTGTSDSPKTASVSVTSDVSTVGKADIAAAANATFNLYSDAFSSEVTGGSTIDLTPGGGTDIYIKVTAEDNSTTVYYKVTVNRAAVQLATPKNLAWDITTPGKAKWDSVEHAEAYTVALFKNGGSTAVYSDSPENNFYDFTNTIKSNGTGSYTFIVAALGDGTNYTAGITSGSSPAYAYAPSTDAGLTTILSQMITAAGTGTSGSPKTASISVAYSVDAVAKANIAATDSKATVYFYGTDIGFTTEDSDGVTLTAGTPTTVYIKITAEDTTSLYYAVTITRAKPVISIGTQPAAKTTVTAGSISGSLSVSASVTESGTASYQWYSADDASKTNPQKIDGKTEASFSIPTGHTAGTYYYFCRVSATDADSVDSDVAALTVEGTDSTLPTSGSSGAITTDSVTDTGLTLNWTKASDNETAEANLKYYVYQSGSNNIDIPENCMASGTLLNAGGTADIATYSVTGLTASSKYYFNVVVEDEAGNKAAYITVSKTTLATQTGSPAFTAGGETPTYGTQITVGSGDLATMTNLSYAWYRSADNSYGGDTDLSVAGTAYTPVEADIGNYLIVVATTDDAAGAGTVVTGAVVVKAAGFTEPFIGVAVTYPTEATSITLTGFEANAAGLEAAVAVNGTDYAKYADLTVDAGGNATITGLAEVSGSTKVKIRFKETATVLAGTATAITAEEAAHALGTLTFAAGSASGTTKITAAAAASGGTYAYKVFDANAAPDALTNGAAQTSARVDGTWTTFTPASSDIAVTTGQEVAVVALDASGNVCGYSIHTVIADNIGA